MEKRRTSCRVRLFILLFLVVSKTRLVIQTELKELHARLKGEVYDDVIRRTLYATDASVYKEMPLAVAYPKDTDDLIQLVRFARQNKVSLIPRTAGTSLAGQVVGSGIVVDVSRYMTRILEINPKEGYAWVEPGVVLDELNRELAPYGLFFGPETSTGNRCMIGGMLGNNACGLHSLVYGSTRDHTLAVEGILSDGSVALFEELNPEILAEKLSDHTLEASIYRELINLLSSKQNQDDIRHNYPDPGIPRRNTGYALDLLLDRQPFHEAGKPFSLCPLLGGSEGTLVLSTRIKVGLVPLPPPHKALVCAHFSAIRETLLANIEVLKHQPTAVELMDHHVLDRTGSNREQEANRFFVVGHPKTILIIEFAENTEEELHRKTAAAIEALKKAGLGYAYPVLSGADIQKAWNLRRAGLGLLSNEPGDAKSVTVIEDTAVHVKDLPAYIEEIEQIFTKNDMVCVYHAHVGTGELHMRPKLNLKAPDDIRKFRMIADETVRVVKKYRGSFSGEHGDGRLRGEFLEAFYGAGVFAMHRKVKAIFDPDHLFNPGKIIDTPPMHEFLRYEPGQETPDVETWFDFSESQGIIRFIEKCNGSGDCRKSHLAGGSMCPSYQATRDEKNTTRARANILREFMSRPTSNGNPFDHPEIYEILDLCLSCKACKTECPSSVDMAKLKAEFLSHWYQNHRIPLRTRLIANIHHYNRLGSVLPRLTNFLLSGKLSSAAIRQVAGIAPGRSLPLLSGKPLRSQAKRKMLKINPSHAGQNGRVYLFVDEFSAYNDAHIGLQTIQLFTALGYEVILPAHRESARTYLSKGLLKQAKEIINQNLRMLGGLIQADSPLIGIEPSAILGFRDEYPELSDPELREAAQHLAKNSLMAEEFLAREMEAGRISKDQFTKERREILLHGHCQQKAVASTAATLTVLGFPENYVVREIPSGCCGMAGSFGYEKEHYDLSMAVGELVLFPAVREADTQTLICAPGTSCRHQIHDGTKRKALHPLEILFQALSGSGM